MGNAVQIETNDTATSAGSPAQAGVAERVYKVVAPAGGASQEDLYGFRTIINQPPPAEDPEAAEKEAKGNRAVAILPILFLVVLGVLAALLIPKLLQTKAPLLYVDLGTRRFDSAGLGARLIARWEGSSGYQLYIDPLDPQHTAGFQAVTVNPPHPVSVVIRLLDTKGAVACQKEVVLPAPGPAANSSDPASNASQALVPMQTTTGDTVQNIAGPDGQIAEITLTGSLPCSQKQYQSFAAWEFFTNFPSLEEQDDWLKHQKPNEQANSRKGHGSADGFGFSTRGLRLPAAIDDDDVIVGDNPSQGTIDTQGGRVFLVGVIGMRNRSAEWQVFPAPVHFHCDKNGACVLTKVNSRTMLQARLVK